MPLISPLTYSSRPLPSAPGTPPHSSAEKLDRLLQQMCGRHDEAIEKYHMLAQIVADYTSTEIGLLGAKFDKIFCPDPLLNTYLVNQETIWLKQNGQGHFEYLADPSALRMDEDVDPACSRLMNCCQSLFKGLSDKDIPIEFAGNFHDWMGELRKYTEDNIEHYRSRLWEDSDCKHHHHMQKAPVPTPGNEQHCRQLGPSAPHHLSYKQLAMIALGLLSFGSPILAHPVNRADVPAADNDFPIDRSGIIRNREMVTEFLKNSADYCKTLPPGTEKECDLAVVNAAKMAIAKLKQNVKNIPDIPGAQYVDTPEGVIRILETHLQEIEQRWLMENIPEDYRNSKDEIYHYVMWRQYEGTDKSIYYGWQAVRTDIDIFDKINVFSKQHPETPKKVIDQVRQHYIDEAKNFYLYGTGRQTLLRAVDRFFEKKDVSTTTKKTHIPTNLEEWNVFEGVRL